MGAVAEVSDNRQPLSNNQLGIAVLVLVILAAVGAGLYFVLKNDTNKGNNGTGKYKAISAQFLSAGRMRTQPLIIGQGFYWAGALPGLKMEFRRTAQGAIYVRYMPPSARKGQGGNFLIIATYPFNQAVNGLKDQAQKAGGATVKGPDPGSIIYVDPTHPKSVYMAWKNDNVQVEVVGTSPAVAVRLAKSGDIRPAS